MKKMKRSVQFSLELKLPDWSFSHQSVVIGCSVTFHGGRKEKDKANERMRTQPLLLSCFLPSIFLSLPDSRPPSLSDTPPLSGPSRSSPGRRRRRVGDRRQLGRHQDDVATGRRGGAHCGGDARRRREGEEEDGGEVIRREAAVLTGHILLPRMPCGSLQGGTVGFRWRRRDRRQNSAHPGLCFFFSGGFSPWGQTQLPVFSHNLNFCFKSRQKAAVRDFSRNFAKISSDQTEFSSSVAASRLLFSYLPLFLAS